MTRRSRAAPALVLSLLATPWLGACTNDSAEDPTAFCDAVAMAASSGSAVSDLNLQEPESIQDAVDTLHLIVRVAPEAVAADAQAVSDVYAAVLEALADTAPGARPELLHEFQGDFDAVADAASRLQAYAEATCDIQFAPPPMPTPTATPLDIVD